MRALCLGIGSEKSAKYHYDFLNQPGYPTISDYDLLIMDLSRLQSSWYHEFAQTRKEFEKFFQNRGICFVTMGRYEKSSKDEGYISSNMDWCPFAPALTIENKHGEVMNWEHSRARSILGSLQFYWQCFFSEIALEHTVLARNRTNDPVSVLIPYLDGFCVFLPRADKENQLVDLIIEKGLNLIPENEKRTAPSSIPAWASLIMSETELELLEIMQRTKQKLGKYAMYKPLYWETGEALKLLVINAFEELGIKVTNLPSESHADFEILVRPNSIGVCEVKGLLGSANRQDLRQLLDYFIEQRDIEKRNVKGIFIVNHNRNEEPNRRSKAATKDALEIIKKYDFTLLTTIQLYEYLTRFWKKELTTENILQQLDSRSS
jgi:hypothetical protein